MKTIFILILAFLAFSLNAQIIQTPYKSQSSTIATNSVNDISGIRTYTTIIDANGTILGTTSPQTVKIESVSLVDETRTDTTYIGYAIRGVSATSADSFKIVQIIKVSGITHIKYPNGSESYNKVWDNRTTYTYKY